MNPTQSIRSTETGIARERLASLLASSEYLSYAYSYPHKTAYRALTPSIDLREAWSREDRSALFLYIHVPFCEQRCGFCNLFTQVQPRDGIEAQYVAALESQAEALSSVLAPARFAQLAIGGGTPTFLSAALLERVFDVAKRLGATLVPTSIEVSPGTLDDDKLAVLVAKGATRVSMGVQSFDPHETSAVSRRQDVAHVERALRGLSDAVDTRNVDLIYGLPGQTTESLGVSIDRAIELGANELYLYPLYIRPLTILGRRPAIADARLSLYRAGRDHLLSRGWRQTSMRMFEAPRQEPHTEKTHIGPRYRCQDDGMVGLGAGARSYTRSLHYATSYAVSQPGIRSRISDFIGSTASNHAIARHGFILDEDERRRRYVLLSLLDRGVDRREYRTRFGGDVLEHFAELAEIMETGLGICDDEGIHLTELGVERSDVLGHWLQSAAVRRARALWTHE